MRRVEPFTEQHREELFALYERIFGRGKAGRFRGRFDWLYRRNPYVREGQVTNWTLTSDSSVVGHLGVVPVDITVGGRRLHGSWICDYMVDPAHRFGTEFASLRASASDSSELPMGYGMPDHVARSYVKLGWKRLAVGPFLVKCLRLGAVARLHAPRRAMPAGSWARRAADVPRFLRQVLQAQFRQAPSPRAGEVELRAQHETSLDLLWERAGSAYPVSVERNHRYLGWRYRFADRDGARLIVLPGSGEARAFAVIEKVRWRGLVAGLVSELIVSGEREADAHALLTFAEDVLRRERVSLIVTEGFPSRLRRMFLRHGFIQPVSREENATFLDRFRTCPEPLVEDVENWLLTPGDSDRSLGYERVAWCHD